MKNKIVNLNLYYRLTDEAVDWIPPHSQFILDHNELFYITNLPKRFKAVIIVGMDKSFDVVGKDQKHIVLPPRRVRRVIKYLLKTNFLKIRDSEPFEEFGRNLKISPTAIIVGDPHRNLVDITAYNDIEYDDSIDDIEVGGNQNEV